MTTQQSINKIMFKYQVLTFLFIFVYTSTWQGNHEGSFRNVERALPERLSYLKTNCR